MSCLIFKHIKDENLGVIVNIERSNTSIQQVAIAFVDDTNFCINGPVFETNI